MGLVQLSETVNRLEIGGRQALDASRNRYILLLQVVDLFGRRERPTLCRLFVGEYLIDATFCRKADGGFADRLTLAADAGLSEATGVVSSNVGWGFTLGLLLSGPAHPPVRGLKDRLYIGHDRVEAVQFGKPPAETYV